MSLIFYDIETSGTSKHFDQILQFAAIRTNADLEEVDRFEIRSRLQPHIIPSPGALHATRMRIDDLLDPSRPSHYEMVCAIRSTLRDWCPATFLGYNSLRFDEEFLRQAFYQCLHPPYLTNTGGSGRSDVLNIVRAAASLRPGILEVPVREDGKPVFKLDRLAPANGFPHLNAHDALADVEATIHLCRIVKRDAPDLWAQFLRLSTKAAVQEFLRKNEAFASFEFFGSGSIATVVTPIGASIAQPNVTYTLDLRCDLDELRSLGDEELAARLHQSPKSVRRLKANGSPLLCALDDVPQELLGEGSPDGFRDRARAVKRDVELIARLVAASEPEAGTYEPSVHVEEQLYEGGFWGDEDGWLLNRFHAAPWEERVGIAAELSDRRLRRLARRIIFYERPDLLPDQDRVAIAEEIRKRRLGLSTVSGAWLTVSAAVEELEKLLAGVTPDIRAGFEGYRAFLAECMLESDPA